MPTLPVIGIGGLRCENSTFSPSRTDVAAFQVQRGEEIIKHYKFLHENTQLGGAANWHGTLVGASLPGGMVTREAFEELAAELLDRLSQLPPLDGFWFDIHGALYVEGMEDVESELLRRIRSVIGRNTTISASMDLHGNVSRQLAHQLDLVTCYRTAPHEDVLETKERACRNLVHLLKNHPDISHPLKAWIPIPILLSGEQTSTRVEPAKRIYAAVPEVEKMEGILDASVWIGYAWADEPRNRAVVVVTGWSQSAVAEGAEKLAKLFWDAHEEFGFVAPTGTYAECLNAALASKDRPYFISDSGDNPTAGGAGDVTYGLRELLKRPEFKEESGAQVIYASVPGPEAVERAVRAGVGETIQVMAGAEVDDNHSGPIALVGRVHAIKHGDRHAVIEAVIQVGSIFVILTKLRKPYHYESDFTDLNLSPRSADLVIVKIGYLEPELYNMAANWMLALTPGGVDQDLKRLGHHRIRRPMWPFDAKFPNEPDLTARFISPSNDPLSGTNE